MPVARSKATPFATTASDGFRRLLEFVTAPSSPTFVAIIIRTAASSTFLRLVAYLAVVSV
jgi:hypothetical protein